MQLAHRNAGISIPRVTYDQIRVGTPIYDTMQLLPGDLLFVENGEHVGRYLGHGTRRARSADRRGRQDLAVRGMVERQPHGGAPAG
jgi:cell wall-associated NlpC family hydrolase